MSYNIKWENTRTKEKGVFKTKEKTEMAAIARFHREHEDMDEEIVSIE